MVIICNSTTNRREAKYFMRILEGMRYMGYNNRDFNKVALCEWKLRWMQELWKDVNKFDKTPGIKLTGKKNKNFDKIHLK